MNTKLRKEFIAAGAVIIAALIGMVGGILGNQENFSLKKENSALRDENTSLKAANSALTEENSALKENNSQLELTNEVLEHESSSSIDIDTNNNEELIDQNLDSILKIKTEYTYSDIQRFESNSIYFRVYENAGYIQRRIGDASYRAILDGKSLSDIRVFFLDYETDDIVFTLVSDRNGSISYSPVNTRTFYCAIISPGYELYVSPPFQIKGGGETSFYTISLYEQNSKFTPPFQICIYAHDTTQTNSTYSIFRNGSIRFNCINAFCDPLQNSGTTYLAETNDSGFLEFNGSYFTLNTKYVLDLALYDENMDSNSNSSPYESASQTVDGLISNSNLIKLFFEYDGSIVSLQDISK